MPSCPRKDCDTCRPGIGCEWAPEPPQPLPPPPRQPPPTQPPKCNLCSPPLPPPTHPYSPVPPLWQLAWIVPWPPPPPLSLPLSPPAAAGTGVLSPAALARLGAACWFLSLLLLGCLVWGFREVVRVLPSGIYAERGILVGQRYAYRATEQEGTALGSVDEDDPITSEDMNRMRTGKTLPHAIIRVGKRQDVEEDRQQQQNQRYADRVARALYARCSARRVLPAHHRLQGQASPRTPPAPAAVDPCSGVEVSEPS
jgi:hypothetical protein